MGRSFQGRQTGIEVTFFLCERDRQGEGQGGEGGPRGPRRVCKAANLGQKLQFHSVNGTGRGKARVREGGYRAGRGGFVGPPFWGRSTLEATI
jgi:hypothetical protein